MPAIRDARGELHVHDMGSPPGNPSGPVERSQASAQRMADFAAERAADAERPQRRHDAEGRPERSYELTPEARQQAKASLAASRARGAVRAGFVKSAEEAKEEPVATPVPATPSDWPQRREQIRQAKVDRFLAAIRATSSNAEAAAQLDAKKHTVEQFISDLRRRGELPADVEQQLRARNPALYRRAAAPVEVDPAGLTDAEHRRAQAAAHVIATPEHIEAEGQEAGAPATHALDVEQPGPDGSTDVATPPGPVPVIEDAYLAPGFDTRRPPAPTEPGIVRGHRSGNNFAPDSTPPAVDDGLSLHLVLDVSAAEMATWPPRRISLFFKGVAIVTMARWASEAP